ncbi:hypothetical protein [Phthorimaea operculella granulovirus]|uniref:Uncharacterized protein n=1 Tax=Phthorimaea operculella granulovirus TaxID=192584 RepID=Q8JS20_9BBAC|nr:hypothetical protein [Phthorimaea operculella granulovirus]AAM70237.1 hypothetical protein [Phthorimaea operculella granulovirus]ANY57428.1 hypothetical protein PhopGVgp039 [Phthorimaea operculella granulovirus]QBH65874.1 hypothetical protein PhopGVgp039 [Phthorimaea operculella granulovirus]QBH66004.1 hypothetical protein PhopGVgp039 [Phthorimaea operculella granulovirus]QBH66134.1 hypothetical protein PhopGVgp039 [Phthorimaea operculella granulovirus]
MLHYQVIVFNYKKLQNIAKHCIHVVENEFQEYTIWRGETNAVHNLIQNNNICQQNNNICQQFDPVYNFINPTKHVITLIGIRVYNKNQLKQIIEREQHRVINFYDNYDVMFLND